MLAHMGGNPCTRDASHLKGLRPYAGFARYPAKERINPTMRSIDNKQGYTLPLPLPKKNPGLSTGVL